MSALASTPLLTPEQIANYELQRDLELTKRYRAGERLSTVDRERVEAFLDKQRRLHEPPPPDEADIDIVPPKHLHLGESEAAVNDRVIKNLRRWIDGNGLSQSQIDDLQQALPDATVLKAATQRTTGELTQDEVQEYYQLSRAKYFRWRQLGQSIPEGPDLPPFSDPKAMVAWYERMKGRGIFKHQCPKLLERLAANGFPSTRAASAPEPSTATTSTASASTATITTPPGIVITEEERGFLVELEHNEKKAVIERRAADEAFARNDLSAYALLSAQYRETAELVRKMTAQKEAVTLAEKTTMKKTDLIELQGPIVKSILKNLVFGPSLRAMFDALGLEAKGIAYDAFISAQAQHVRECFADLVKNKLAEPFALQAA